MKIDLLDDSLLPARNIATAVNPCLHAMHHHGPVISASNVVLARPNHMNWSASIDRFHYLRHLRGPVRRGARSSTEASTAQKRVDFDLLGFHAQKLRSHNLIECLQLRTRPDFRAVAMKFDHAIHRFHRCVREIRKRVLGFDRLCRSRQALPRRLRDLPQKFLAASLTGDIVRASQPWNAFLRWNCPR